MKFCFKCGAQLPDDSVFCSTCGANVADSMSYNPVVPAPPAAVQSGSGPKPPKKKSKALFIILPVVLVVLIAAGVFSADRDRAMSVSSRLRTGTVMINGGLFYGADAPFGGYKSSGVGRQNGLEGFEQHLQTKSIGFTDALED